MKVDGHKSIESLHRLLARIDYAAVQTLKAGMDAAESSERATKAFKDQSGKTRASIKSISRGDFRGRVRIGGFAKFIESGTRPHLIVARGRALRFVVNGATFYRKMVRHPGTKAKPFVHEARESAARAIDLGVAFFIGAAINR